MAETPDDMLAPNSLESVDGDEADKAEDARKEKLLADAMANFKLAKEYWNPIYQEWLEDVRFANGEQWPDDVRQQRLEKGRPCLVINRMPGFIQLLTNDQRQNRPAIKVHPIDDDADIETGKVIEGLVRHIEYNSSADAAYDTAMDGTVKGGLGFFRIVTDYVDPASFDQEILIKRVPNPLSILLDPSFREPDGSDAEYGFAYEDMTKDAFERAYPNALKEGAIEWNIAGTNEPEWVKDGGRRVAEYLYKEYQDQTIHLLSDGETVEESGLQDYMGNKLREHVGSGAPIEAFQPPQIVNSKVAKVPVVKWCKFTAAEILEETELPGSGKYIPIIPVLGSEQEIDGKRVLKGIVRDAKDAQRMLNYWKSAETEAIALAPRAPFIVAEGQIEDYEHDWKSANRENHAVLKYKPTSIGGTPIGPPMRQVVEPAVQAITQASLNASDDIKAVINIYDPSLGAQRADQSGIAIQKLNNQAQTSNFHFTDNLTRSLKHAGRILIDLIPKIYDTERAARIIGDDGEQKVVRLNASQPVEGQTDKEGKPLLYRLDAGTYDVTVDVGPSYASKRQEAVASILDFLKSFPQAAPYIGDVLAKNFDWPGGTEIAERLKKMLPPQLQDDGKQPQIPPQVQAQMQQMSQMVQQLTQQLHETQDKLEKKLPEIESKERIEFAKIQAEVEVALAKMGSQESMALLQHQLAEIEARQTNILKFLAPIDVGAPQFDPSAAGGMPAQGDAPGPQDPTGGASPGLPMEGNPIQ